MMFFFKIDIHTINRSLFNQSDLHMENHAPNKNLLDNVTIAALEHYTINKSAVTTTSLMMINEHFDQMY